MVRGVVMNGLGHDGIFDASAAAKAKINEYSAEVWNGPKLLQGTGQASGATTPPPGSASTGSGATTGADGESDTGDAGAERSARPYGRGCG